MYNEHEVIARKLLIAVDEPDLAEALQSFFEKNHSPSIPWRRRLRLRPVRRL